MKAYGTGAQRSAMAGMLETRAREWRPKIDAGKILSLGAMDD